MDFRKDFDTAPKTNLWNILEEIKVPFELRAVARVFTLACADEHLLRNLESLVAVQ